MTKTTMASFTDVCLMTEERAREVGLKGDEWKRAQAIIGRIPNKVELGCISAMWSEHCSYKSSRIHLRELPTTGPRVVIGPGENAGVVDVGDGIGICFKVESHNHPSYIEPYQGAATGAGGILRDVFTMGARPFAAGNLFRFGRPSHPKTPALVRGVVKGVGDYGNCFGVPTVWTDVRFDPSYDGNILVNALAIGVVNLDEIFLGRAEGVGNPVFYAGAKTGRDGIHGATMASDGFSDDKEMERPTVQVGDPFKEKLLLEACLEAMKTGALTGIQDMGAAGLTSSAFEMASRAGNGVALNLDLVPVRETKMSAYELMLSESQERMLLICAKGREDEVIRVFQKWDLDCTAIGVVTDDGMVRLEKGGAEVACLPARELADEAPRYDRPHQKRAPSTDDRARVLVERDPTAVARGIVSHPDVASRAFILRQFDREVGVNSLADAAHAPAATVQIPSTNKAIAIALIANNHACALDAKEGARRTVVEGALRAAAVGAMPLAVSDCLNYGNPEREDVMQDIVDGIHGLKDACLALGAPVVSGNVSLYNDTDGRSVQPTPTIAFLGLIDDVTARAHYRAEDDDRVFLVGNAASSLEGAAVLNLVGEAPRNAGLTACDLPAVNSLVDVSVAMIQAGVVRTMRPVLAGGLTVALAEIALATDRGITVDAPGPSAHVAFFGEDQPAMLVIAAAKDADAVRSMAKSMTVTDIGSVGGVALSLQHGDVGFSMPLDRLRELWEGALPIIVARPGSTS